MIKPFVNMPHVLGQLVRLVRTWYRVAVPASAGFVMWSAVVVVFEASVPKVYPRVTLASASTLSGLVLRTLRGGEGLPNMCCLVASRLGTSVASVRSSAAPLCKGDTRGLRKG